MLKFEVEFELKFYIKSLKDFKFCKIELGMTIGEHLSRGVNKVGDRVEREVNEAGNNIKYQKYPHLKYHEKYKCN